MTSHRTEFKRIKRKIAQQIYEDILAKDNSVILYLVIARGGSGKTYLARDLGMRLGSETGYESATREGWPRWSQILDLYDADVNSNHGLERRLMAAFSPAGGEFEEYLEERSLYEMRFKTGVRERELEEQRLKVEQAFGRGMVNASQQARLVIPLDTVERLQNAADRIQQIGEFSNDTATVKGWLLSQISRWNNCVVLLFGRPAGDLWDDIESYAQQINQQPDRTPIQVKRIYLDRLEPDEAPALFDLRIAQYPQLAALLNDDLRATLVQQTDGNPLLIDLALQCLVRTDDPDTLLEALASGRAEEVAKRLLDTFYGTWHNVEEQSVLRYLAIARRGLHEGLLRAIDASAATRLWEKLQQMEDLPFIKFRIVSVPAPGHKEPVDRPTYFFHDEMYLICDRHLFHSPGEVIDITRRIIGWYAAQEDEFKTEATIRGNFQVESAYYRLRADPEGGYKWYLPLADEAIRSAQISHDIRLANELFYFIHSAFPRTEEQQAASSQIDRAIVQANAPRLEEWVDLDSATLWVKRFTVRGDRKRARELGDLIGPRIEELCRSDHPQFVFSSTEFAVFHAQALMYVGEVDAALEMYREAVKTLEAAMASDQIPALSEPFSQWRISLILGRAHNNIGYVYWRYKGQYQAALKELQRAKTHLRASDLLLEEVANTDDSLGRVHALLGHKIQAETLVENGLGTRRDLHLPYREALSLVSQAIVHLNFDRPDLALPVAENALTIIRSTGVMRGLGRARVTLGRICRVLSENWSQPGYGLEKAMQDSLRSETELSDALDIFSNKVTEPIALMEAYNEMGCTFRARYDLFRNNPKSSPELADLTFTQAQNSLGRAIRLARENKLLVSDSYQDIAELFAMAGRIGEAEEWLKKAETPLLKKQIDPMALPEIADASVDEYYNLLGKVELLRGNLAMARTGGQPAEEDVRQAAWHYLFAATHFTRFSSESFALGKTYRQMYNQFKRCKVELVNQVRREEIPLWIEKYDLKQQALDRFFRDVFGLFE